MSNIFVGLKKTCLGVSDRVERDKDNETCLKEGGEIEMSTTVLHLRAAPSLDLLTYFERVADNLQRIKNINLFTSRTIAAMMKTNGLEETNATKEARKMP